MILMKIVHKRLLSKIPSCVKIFALKINLNFLKDVNVKNHGYICETQKKMKINKIIMNIFLKLLKNININKIIMDTFLKLLKNMNINEIIMDIFLKS